MPLDPASAKALIDPLIAQWGAFAVIFIGICYVAGKLGKALIESYNARIAREEKIGQERSDMIKLVTDAMKDSRASIDAACAALKTAVDLRLDRRP